MSGEMIDAILDRIEESTDYYNYRARNARTARAELAQLRAAADERDDLRARVTELEAQLQSARDIASYACETWPARYEAYYRPDHEDAIDDLRSWLADCEAQHAATLHPRKCDRCNPLAPCDGD